MNYPDFTNALRREIVSNIRNNYHDNWDGAERGPEPPPDGYPALRALVAPLRRWAERFGAAYRRLLKPILSDIRRYFQPARPYLIRTHGVEPMQYLFDRLEDQASRDLLVKLAAFRLMGHRRVKLPRNNDEFWQNENRIATLPAVADPVQVEFMNLALTPRDLGPIGYDARLFGTARGIAMVYLQRQYDLERLGGICRVVPGDVVLDAGGCWGDTAVYFAERTGPSGKVVVFEFIPSNLVMLRRNLDLNPQLKDRVTVVDRPLWSVPGQELFYVDWGPGSRVSFNKLREDFPDTKTCTTTIDNFVDQSGLERVDFIKMDIEGAEPYALRGAERTIRKHRPKLAVSLYHSIDDFNSIPRVIDGFDLGYRFYLEHHTIYENETVLFCIPEGRAG